MKQSRKFSSAEELRRWFEENHATSPGLWIRFEYTVSPSMIGEEDAMKIAIGYGWVDDRIKRINDLTFRRKFIPRRDGSLWTESQRAIVEELTKLGQMEKPGQEAVLRAKLDGSWASAQSSPASDAMLETFTSVLRPHEPAFSRFLRLPPASQRTYAVGYCSAKRPDTRARRLAEAVEKLSSEAAPKGGKKRGDSSPR